MEHVAVVADIRPGRRGQLERVLAEGPPFDLGGLSIEHDEVFLGDAQVLVVFSGPDVGAELHQMAFTPELSRRMRSLSELVTAPRILAPVFSWDRPAAGRE